MLQDQSRNRTPMPGAQAPGAAQPDTGPARAEAGIAAMLAVPLQGAAEASEATLAEMLSSNVSVAVRSAIEEHALAIRAGREEPDQSDEAFEHHAARQSETDERLRTVQCQSLADLWAKLAYLTPIYRPDFLDQSFGDHLGALVSNIDALISPRPPRCANAVGLPIKAHRSARAALTAACNPADEVFVRQAGGDTSDEAMAPARAIHEAASDAETDAWDALLETRPSDADGLLRMLRYIAGAGPMEVLGDAREFGRNIAEAAEAALRSPAAASAASDPILAGIAETRVALDQARALEAASTGNLPTAWGDACEAAVDALHEHVLAIAPTTLDGCRAAARLMLDLRTGLGLELEDEVTLLLKRIAGEPPAVAEVPVAAPATPVLDAIRTHEEAWARHTQAIGLYDSMGDLPSQRPAPDGEIEAADAVATEAGRRSDQAWRDLFRSRPQDLHELWLLLRHVEQHHAAHHGMADAPDIWGTLTGAVAAMRTTSKAPAVLPHDLSKLSVRHLSGLYEVCRQQRDILLAVEGQPMCEKPGGGGYNALGDIVEAEGSRFAFLSDDICAELERRRPAGEEERNFVLETRIRHHLTCNGTIEPELLAEVASAWGAR